MAAEGAVVEDAFVVIGLRRAVPAGAAAGGAGLEKAERNPRPPPDEMENEPDAQEKDAEAKMADELRCNGRANEIAGARPSRSTVVAAASPPQPEAKEEEAELQDGLLEAL